MLYYGYHIRVSHFVLPLSLSFFSLSLTLFLPRLSLFVRHLRVLYISRLRTLLEGSSHLDTDTQTGQSGHGFAYYGRAEEAAERERDGRGQSQGLRRTDLTK